MSAMGLPQNSDLNFGLLEACEIMSSFHNELVFKRGVDRQALLKPERSSRTRTTLME